MESTDHGLNLGQTPHPRKGDSVCETVTSYGHVNIYIFILHHHQIFSNRTFKQAVAVCALFLSYNHDLNV